MKVLWLTSSPMPDHAVILGQTPSPRGGWIPALAQALVADGRVELAVATNLQGVQEGSVTVNGIRYYTIPQPGGKINARRLPTSLINGYQRVVKDFQPQVLHIHGTEHFQGLLTGRGYLTTPTVISIQGIIDVCARHYLGGVPLCTLLFKRTLRDWICLDGLIEQKIRWIRRAKWEREILATNSAFIGRTIWDRAHSRRLNPQARYFHCDELIRHPFLEAQWDIGKLRRHSIFTSCASGPFKGFHILIKAAGILRREFPDLTIRTPLAYFYPKLSGLKRFWKNRRSMGYARYLTDLIREEKLENHIVPFASLDANGMAEQLLQAHVFVLPSLIENSPNSLAEAMLVGTPSAVSFVGGVPSMAQDGESALFFPSGDEAVLAEQIRRVFLDDDLASRLSVSARDVARTRQNKEKIINDSLEIYRSVIRGNHSD